MEEEQKTEPVNEERNKKDTKIVKGKGLKAYIIVIVVIALAISYGCGFVLGKKLYEKDNKQEDKKEDNKEDNKVVEITQQNDDGSYSWIATKSIN